MRRASALASLSLGSLFGRLVSRAIRWAAGARFDSMREAIAATLTLTRMPAIRLSPNTA